MKSWTMSSTPNIFSYEADVCMNHVCLYRVNDQVAMNISRVVMFPCYMYTRKKKKGEKKRKKVWCDGQKCANHTNRKTEFFVVEVLIVCL